MKYENKQEVNNLFRQISNHECNLKDIQTKKVSIIIKAENTTLYTIGTESGSEHEYTKQAQELLDYITTDLQKRIDNLKSMLEQL